MKLSVILPAYNEAENLKTILPKLKEALDTCDCEYNIYVVDTMTEMDNTKVICEENNVIYTSRKNANFYGDAIRTGIELSDGQYTLIMDSDGSHSPNYIPEMLQKIDEGSDLVIGSRYCKGGKTENSWVLRTMSKMVNTAYSFIFRLKVKDVSNSFRLYKTCLLKDLVLECDNFDIVEELLIKIKLVNSKVKITEIPITFETRQKGKSKRSFFKFALSYFFSIIKLWKLKRKYIKEQKKKESNSEKRG